MNYSMLRITKRSHIVGILYLLIMALPSTGCKDKPASKEVVVTNDEVMTNQSLSTTNPEDDHPKKSILFFGDSLTAGYGLDEDESFPSLIQERIDSLGWPYSVVNGGLSGETSAGGKGRIDWVLRNDIDVFVLELGANDVLRGLDLGETEKNLSAILDAVIAKHPNIPIVIAGMQAPPNMGEAYAQRFETIYVQLAKRYNTALIPFLLEGVAGDPSLNLADGKHPNAVGQLIVRDNVWKVLQKILMP